MKINNIEQLGSVLEKWVHNAPRLDELDRVTLDGQKALVEAGMVQYNPDGWDFKLQEKHPTAPKAQFKLMIREAPGVNTDPSYYDRFVLPSVLQADEDGVTDCVRYILGYPNAGTPIAETFVRLAGVHLGITHLEQLEQDKVTHHDGSRELGEIKSDCQEGEMTLAVDDTTVGGDTKIEGWRKIVEHNLGYAGLILVVERDPLGSALVRERTNAIVQPSMHWITLVKQAAETLDLPKDAVQKELDYAMKLFEWNVANGNLGSLPNPDLIAEYNS